MISLILIYLGYQSLISHRIKEYSLLFVFFAGTPATVELFSTSFKTKLPAATIEFLPIVIFPNIVLAAKIEAPLLILGCLFPDSQ